MLIVSRTKIVLIGTHQRLNAVESFSVAADNTSLQRVDSFKYLGVTVEETFPWKEYAKPIRQKRLLYIGVTPPRWNVLPKST